MQKKLHVQNMSPIHNVDPSLIAITATDSIMTYGELKDKVLMSVTNLREHGFKKGDILGCVAINSPEQVILYFAALEIGIIFFPISYKFPATQILEILQRFNAKAVYSPDVKVDFPLFSLKESTKAEPSIIDVNAPLNIILSSGTTGFPKACLHSFTNHVASAIGSQENILLTKDDAWLLSLPLFHIGGLAIVNRCVLAGATIVFYDQIIPIANQIIKNKITHLSLVATQLQTILAENPECLASIRVLLLGGGSISSSLLQNSILEKISCYTSYGLTEMSSQVTTGVASSNSAGKVLPFRELKIVDENIWVKGETLFLGYLQSDGEVDRALDDDGWFNTKDLGEFVNNNLIIKGRIDNMFISGGENVHPEEIEMALKLHPQIIDALVFSIFDSKFGQLPVAIIKGDVDYAVLTHFLSDKIARFKRPRAYYPWPKIENDSLKIQRKQVIEQIKNIYFEKYL